MTMNFTAAIKVPSDQLQFLQSVVDAPNADLCRDDVVYENSVRFSDNSWALFQVISTNDPAEDACWTQVVLFDERGNEMACSDVGESILGSTDFLLIDGKNYTVNVIAE